MGSILRVKTTIILSVLAFVSFAGSAGFATGHHGKHLSQSPAHAIDSIITGANNGSLRLDSLPDNTGECGLCYHRQLMNKRNGKNNKVPLQPFPGD